MWVSPTLFSSVPFGFPRGPISPPMPLSPRLQRRPLQGRQRQRPHRLAVPEECRRFPFTCCQDDAYGRTGCREREVALTALNGFKVHLFASLWPNSVSMRRTDLRNEELLKSKRVAPALLLRSSGAHSKYFILLIKDQFQRDGRICENSVLLVTRHFSS